VENEVMENEMVGMVGMVVHNNYALVCLANTIQLFCFYGYRWDNVYQVADTVLEVVVVEETFFGYYPHTIPLFCFSWFP
jgi:hypothetical protein